MRCCKESPAPKVEEGRHISTTGAGSSQDPLVISATTSLDVEDSSVFNVILEGTGTLDSPWLIRLAFAPTAGLGDIPNVDDSNAANGYVVAYNATDGIYELVPPTTVPAGSISVSHGVTGDGSPGSPLLVDADLARYIQVTADGVGLSDAGLNLLIRRFADAAARDAATLAPVEGTFANLGDNPLVLQRFNGTDWEDVNGGHALDIEDDAQLLALSGSYAGGPVTTYIRQITQNTDSTGALEVIPAADLVGYSGVLSCTVQETGTTTWHCRVMAGVDAINGFAHRLDTGEVYSSTTVTGTVTALLY